MLQMRGSNHPCAYCDDNGYCWDDMRFFVADRGGKCKGICRRYKTPEEVQPRHDRHATDRELTPMTEDIVRRWHNEGMTALQIAIVLNRSTGAIDEILKGEGENERL